MTFIFDDASTLDLSLSDRVSRWVAACAGGLLQQREREYAAKVCGTRHAFSVARSTRGVVKGMTACTRGSGGDHQRMREYLRIRKALLVSLLKVRDKEKSKIA